MAARRRDEIEASMDDTEVMRTALTTVAFAVFVVDEDGRYLAAWSSREDDLAVPARDIVGQTVRDLLPASRAAEVEGLIRLAIDTDEEQTTDFPVEGPKGRLHLAASFRRVRAPGPARVLIALQDLTHEEELARKLRESERRYRALLDNAADAIFVIDVTSGRFSEANARAIELFGVERERLLTLAIADVSAPVQPDGTSSTVAIAERLAQALAGDHPVFEWALRRADGQEVPCELRLERVPLADRVAVLGSAVDISAHKALIAKMTACREHCRQLMSVELRALLDELREVAKQQGSSDVAERVATLAQSIEGVVEVMGAALDGADLDD